jgi:arabinan endo-1,5-alpha-L-arabinosidase
MTSKPLLTVAILFGGLALCSCQTNGAAGFGFARDPARVHDPSTIVEGKGGYWSFSTGPGISSRWSPDLTHWTNGPAVFANVPDWTKAVPGNRGYFWAPDVIRTTNGYFLYYSVSSFGKNTSAIGLAVTPTLDRLDPKYGWQDRGVVVRSESTNNFNTIDPSVLLDADRRLWLAFGSYWSGIKLVELNLETGLRIATNSPVYPLAWNESIEAACLYQRGNAYYLFVNWGRCCVGTNSTYEIRVGRSDKITGPYVDRQGRDMLQGGGNVFLASKGKRIGPGHAGILKENNKEFVSYHYYDGENAGRARLEIAPLRWTDDGWPEAAEPLSASVWSENPISQNRP